VRIVLQVHDAILDDLVYPTEIVGKRIRYRVDGSKVLKVRWKDARANDMGQDRTGGDRRRATDKGRGRTGSDRRKGTTGVGTQA
jgi:small subunit ribosomal protein S7e